MLLIFEGEERPRPGPPCKQRRAQLRSVRVLLGGYHQKSRASLWMRCGKVGCAEGLFTPSMGFTPTRCALRGQPVAVRPNFVPDEFVEPGGSQPAVTIRKTKRPREGALCFLAEREGFEPSVRLHVRLISSQVHSTTLPPLQRGCAWSARAGKFTR